MKTNRNFYKLLYTIVFWLSFHAGYSFMPARNIEKKDYSSRILFAEKKYTQDYPKDLNSLKSDQKKIQITDYDTLFIRHNNYYIQYNSEKKYKLARKYLDSTLFFAKKSEIKDNIYVALINGVYFDITIDKNYINARKKYEELFRLREKDTLSPEIAELYFGYADVLEKLGEFQQANFYLKKCASITDSHGDEKNSISVLDLQAKFEAEKKETEYQQQAILEGTQYKNKKIAYVFITLLILSLILFYFFYQNTVLKQNNKLKAIQSQIQLNIINATLDGQELERKKIAAVLHDNISAQLSSAGLHLSAFSAITKIESEEITKTRAILKETHDKVRDLSHELSPTLLAKFGLFYAVRDLCEKYSNSIVQFEYSCSILQNRRYREEYEMKVFFIITELFNNILKHGEASRVNLVLEEQDNQLVVYLRDNGNGFDTNKSKSTEGFGLTQIRARVSSMAGKFIITSSPNKGTSVQVKLPVAE